MAADIFVLSGPSCADAEMRLQDDLRGKSVSDNTGVSNTVNRLLWTAMAAGFAIATAIGGALYSGVIDRFEALERINERIRDAVLTHVQAEGHPAALQMTASVKQQLENFERGHNQYHEQLESRVSRLERIFDNGRSKGKPLFDDLGPPTVAEDHKNQPPKRMP